jgi:hypothetical protein
MYLPEQTQGVLNKTPGKPMPRTVDFFYIKEEKQKTARSGWPKKNDGV